MHHETNVPLGYCQCGCGEKTNISPEHDRRRGHIKGQPYRFIAGHQRRKSPNEYVIEDHGYETPCWVWQRSLARGYPYRVGKGTTYAHIQNWEAKHGPVPDGLVIDHLCRVPRCVNPDHLEPVHPAINVRRGDAAKLTQEDVDVIRATSRDTTNVAIARRYGMDPSTISRIRNGHRWKSTGFAGYDAIGERAEARS